ncbi:MAG: hypothetical protein CMP48_09005 [Rickettsiales bacterium]|nr:hypothetical protein [Rickettsiales bacterium]
MPRITAIIFFVLYSFFAQGQTFDQIQDQVEQHMSEKEWELAAEKLEYCLSHFDLDPATEAGLMHNLGYSLLEAQDYIGAKFYLETTLQKKYSIYKAKNGDYAKTEELLGDLSLKIGQFEKAQIYFLDAQRIINDYLGTNSDENVEALIRLGQFAEAVGDFTGAHHYFDSALLISELIHHAESADYANVANHIGRIYVKNGDLPNAEKFLLSANAAYLNLGEEYSLQYIESLENLAILYQHKGDFNQSEKLLLNIEKEKRELSTISEELLLETLNDLGILYHELNNFIKAKSYFEEVYAISKNHLGKDHKYYATAINNLAAIAKEEGELAAAETLLIEATEIFEKIYGMDHPKYANALNNLASVEREMGAYISSESHYQKVLKIDRIIYGENHPEYATTLTNLGILYSAMGRNSSAGVCYSQALEIRRNTLGKNHPSYGKSLENMGMYFYSLGKLTRAEEFLREAIDIQLAQIKSIFPGFTQNERSRFYATIKADLERYTFIVSQMLGEHPDLVQNILDYQIATKGILFSSSEKVHNLILNSTDERLIKEYNDWSDATLRLAGLYQLGEDKLRTYGIDLKKAEEAVERMEKSLMFKSAEFANLFIPEEVNWRTIRRALKEDQALVEIVRFREFASQQSEEAEIFGFTDKVHYLYIILKPDSYVNPEYVLLDNGAALEVKGFSLYKHSVKYEIDLRASYINYWEPVDDKLGSVKNVLVSPDGVYFKMNLNLLKIPKKDYVIDKYYVTYLTSSRDLYLNRNFKPSNKHTAVLMGNPSFGTAQDMPLSLQNLPGAELEVQEIEEELMNNGWQVSTTKNAEATEARLKTANNPSVLHIATHGYFSDSDPVLSRITPGYDPMFKSGLFLTGALTSYKNYNLGKFQDATNDGILSAYEASNLHLQDTRLVVLSACETALGDIQSGEGVYGLQRAMMVAGAKNLITSMTKVDDEATQYLMTLFYQEFIKTNDVTRSLEWAQIKLREKYPDPRIWGAFLLTGTG